MNTRDIIAVRKVCETGNLSKAAGQLYITPQALSLTVKKMEAELGVQLFHRVSGGMTLTEYGKIFYEKSETLIHELDEMSELFRLDANNEKGVLRLAFSLGILAEIMPETIWKFGELYPNFQINFIEGTDQKVEELVRDGVVDLGICIGPCSEDEFEVQQWCSFEHGALINKNSRIYERMDGADHISITDLKDENIIVENKDFKIYGNLVKLCRTWGFEPKIYFETTEIAFAFALADANKGVAITPKNAVDITQYKNVYLASLDELLPWEWCFIKKKNQRLAEIEKCFIDFLIGETGLEGQMF